MKAAILKGLKKLLEIFLSADEEKRKKRTGLIVGLFFVSFILPAVAISAPGILLKGFFDNVVIFFTGDDGDIETTNAFDFDQESLSENKMYINIRDTYIDYLESLNKKFDERAEEIQIQNAYTIEYEDEDGNIVKETKYPEVIKNIIINKPELRHLMAYIAVKYIDSQTQKDNYVFNKEESKKYLENITICNESITGKNPIIYTVITSIKDVEQIAKTYFTEQEYGKDYIYKQQQFLTSFESLADIKDEVASQVYDYIDLSTLNINANGMEIPHILQYVNPWGSAPYGSSTVGKGGCGVTAMAMIQAYLTGKVLSPASIAKWSNDHGYYIPGQGTAWGFFSAYSSSIGITCKNLGKNSKAVITALEEGRPVIASMGPGTFTSNGHFIVLRGITKDGKILVNDPNDNYYSKNFYKKEFDINLIYAESKNFWSFEK